MYIAVNFMIELISTGTFYAFIRLEDLHEKIVMETMGMIFL